MLGTEAGEYLEALEALELEALEGSAAGDAMRADDWELRARMIARRPAVEIRLRGRRVA